MLKNPFGTLILYYLTYATLGISTLLICFHVHVLMNQTIDTHILVMVLKSLLIYLSYLFFNIQTSLWFLICILSIECYKNYNKLSMKFQMLLLISDDDVFIVKKYKEITEYINNNISIVTNKFNDIKNYCFSLKYFYIIYSIYQIGTQIYDVLNASLIFLLETLYTTPIVVFLNNELNYYINTYNTYFGNKSKSQKIDSMIKVFKDNFVDITYEREIDEEQEMENHINDVDNMLNVLNENHVDTSKSEDTNTSNKELFGNVNDMLKMYNLFKNEYMSLLEFEDEKKSSNEKIIKNDYVNLSELEKYDENVEIETKSSNEEIINEIIKSIDDKKNE